MPKFAEAIIEPSTTKDNRDSKKIFDQQRISTEELGNLLAAFGNSESKANTLRVMRPGMIYTRRDLHVAFISSQGRNTGWRTARDTTFDYCEDDLFPVGAVAQDVIDEFTNTFGYIKTKYGEQVGDPLAGFLLDYSKRYPDSALHDIFGGTNSRSSSVEIPARLGIIDYRRRSPILRLKILSELVTSGYPVRVVDLANHLGENSMLCAHHLSRMERYAAVQYDSTKEGKPFSYFSVSALRPDNKPIHFRKDRYLTARVFELICSDSTKYWSIKEVKDIVEGEGILKQVRTLRTRISCILVHLKNLGYLNQGKFTGDIHSEAQLTDAQRRKIQDLLDILEAYSSQDSLVLQRGKELASRLTEDEISQLMKKAKDHSSNANQRPLSETKNDILCILQSSPRITKDKVADLLRNYSINLSPETVSKILAQLKAAHKARSERNGLSWEWMVA